MLIFGVDGGGTKTAGLAVDENGRVVGWDIGTGSNYHVLGLEGMYASVSKVARATLDGVSPDAACYCLAAADMPHDFIQLRGKLSQSSLIPVFTVHNDVIGIFRAGSRFPYGVGVVCGTGFNAGGISEAGVEFRLPALGGVTGDYAGGDHITVRALGAAFRGWDGRGEPTQLQEAILQHLDAPSYDALAEWYVQGKLTAKMIKHLAPLVFEVSEAGDPIARGIIRDEGVELGTAANAILRRLNLTDTDCDVVIGGSVAFGKGALLMDTVRATVAAQSPRAHVKRLDVPPVVGAVLLAADSVNFAITDEFMTNLRATLPAELQVPATE